MRMVCPGQSFAQSGLWRLPETVIDEKRSRDIGYGSGQRQGNDEVMHDMFP